MFRPNREFERKSRVKPPTKEPSAAECVYKCVECIFDLLVIFGYRPVALEKEIVKACVRWQKMTDLCDGDWVAVAKYKLASFYIVHAADEGQMPLLPRRPFEAADQPKVLVGGRAGRFITCYLNRKNHTEEERLSFLTSILQAKKGFPRPGKQKVEATVKEFVETITTVKEQARGACLFPTWGDVPAAGFADSEAFLSVDSMKRQLRRTVREVFEGVEYTDVDRVRPFFPSTSANYINSRSKGGAVGTILNDPTILSGLRREGGFLDIRRELDRKNLPEDENRGEGDETLDLEQPAMMETYRILWLRITARAAHEANDVTPVGLAEATKVRVITKEPPFRMTMLRSLWKFVHTTLRRHRAFALIGEPVTEDYLLERLGRGLAPNEKFLSGDYKAATDNLHSWVSRTIAEELADCLGLEELEKQLLIEGLTEHIVEGRKQARGQLMGSIVSFPVLCLANAAMTRWAHEVATKRIWRLRDVPAMFNGDDVLLKTTPTGRTAWAKITAFGGLEESIGKTFFERGFANINSQNFRYAPEDPTYVYHTRRRSPEEYAKLKAHSSSHIDMEYIVKRECPFRTVKFVNMGLVKGLKRSGAGMGTVDDPFKSFGARYRDLIRSAPQWAKEACHTAFIKANKEVLDKCTPIPWYVPEWLGGLGLTGLHAPSDLDRRIARMILYNWAAKRPVALGNREAGWATWKLANQMLPKPHIVSTETEGVKDWRRLVSLKVVDLLFDKGVSIARLLKTVAEDKKTGKALRHNAKLWSPQSYKNIVSSGQGLTDEEMVFKGKFDSMLPGDPLEELQRKAAAQAGTTLD